MKEEEKEESRVGIRILYLVTDITVWSGMHSSQYYTTAGFTVIV